MPHEVNERHRGRSARVWSKMTVRTVASTRAAKFVLPGHPKTFKALRVHHGRNVYAVHSKDMKVAKKTLEDQKNLEREEARAALQLEEQKVI